LFGQFDKSRNIGKALAVGVVKPMHAEQIERVGRIGLDGAQFLLDRRRDRGRVLQLGDSRQHDAGLTKTPGRPLQHLGVNHAALKSQTRHSSFPLHCPQLAGCAAFANQFAR
jgi:hypothetical protein